jgi:hypothetical protein
MMKLPFADRAYVPLPKLRDYLLSETHPVGRSKARFFRAHGFDDTSVEVLEHELLRLARSEDVQSVTESPYGVKYSLDGVLRSPRGRYVTVRTVWIIDAGTDRPRFVTAFPA